MAKLYDIVATRGEYTNQQGETKKRFMNVGVVMNGDNGPYMLLDACFNPAGLTEQGRESIILGLYKPRDKNQDADNGFNKQSPSQAMQTPPAAGNQPQGGGNGQDFNDDIPF